MSATFARVLALALFGLFLPHSGQAQNALAPDCIDYQGFEIPVECSQTTGRARDLAYEDGYLYVAAHWPNGLSVLEETRPGEFSEIANLAWSTQPQTILVNGLVYVGLDDGNLWIVDVSDPAHPVVSSTLTFATDDAVSALALEGNVLFAAAGSAGLKIIDVSVPALPAVISTWVPAWGRPVRTVAIHEGVAYVGDTSGAFDVVDIDDLASPVSVKRIISGVVNHILVVGTHMFVATAYAAGVPVYDLEDPLDPLRVGVIPVRHSATDVAVHGNRAYVSSSAGPHEGTTIEMADITDPGAPEYTGWAPVLPYHNVISLPDHVASGTVDGVVTFPAHDYQRAPLRRAPGPGALGMRAAGDYIFTNSGYVRPWDISNPLAPTLASAQFGYGYTERFDVEGDHLVLSGSQPVYGGIAYYVVAYDVSDPGSIGPRHPTGMLSDHVEDVAVEGDHAFLAKSSTLETRSLPGLDFVASISPPASVKGIRSRGGDLYGTGAELQIFDARDPSAVLLRSRLALGSCHDVVFAGSIAYVGGAGALHIVEVTDPDQPVLIRSVGVGVNPVREHAVHEGFVYIPSPSDHGVQIVDCRDPQIAMPFAWIYPMEFTRAYSVLDLKNALYLGFYDALMLGDFQCLSPAVTVTEAFDATIRFVAAPNPFVERVTFSFRLEDPGSVRIDVFDVLGRRVRSLADGELPAGAHRVRWDGRSERGGVSPAGVYFIRIEQGARIESGRIVRLQ